MATAVANKPLLPPKTKRPPVPFVQTSVNGNKPSQVPPSPSSATKRLPGQKHPPPTPTSASSTVNSVARPKRKESQRPGEQYGRLQRLQTRNNVAEGGSLDKRAARKFPEPYVPSETHVLKKFKGHPPSLIVHLHPTHFRFDQQDGSFSYHSEMRLFIEHLQKKTVPHDMLEEFRASNVRFYDGWLIVRVVDHKSVAATAGASSNTDADDQIPFSIHNYNKFITPSPYAPYPAQEQPKMPSREKSPALKQEPGEGSSSHVNGDSSSIVNGEPRSDNIFDGTGKPGKPQPKTFHVALRPTILSKHIDLMIDSMMPDPRAVNRRQSQAFPSARASGSTSMAAPNTPLTAAPPTPTLEKGPIPKRQKTQIEPKDLLDYEAKVVNATAPPIYLDPVDSLEEAQVLQGLLKDPYHDEEPPSPKGRKRTVAELAADDALAKEQERFMLIMDERNASGPAAGNAATVDGQAAGALFQPRFERFNALDNIKAAYEQRKQREQAEKMHQDAQRRAHQEAQEEAKRQELTRAAQQQTEMNRRRMQQERVQAAALAAQTHQNMPQMNGVPPNMQRQMMQTSQAQGSSPVVRTSTPHVNSSPVVAQMRGGHGIPMAVSSSNQGGAGSPPRPGSALQHGHPGIPMARGPSNQGPSRNGTPQVAHSTPGMPNATPVMRHGTPAQHMSQASPHGSMIAHTPQMGQAMMGSGQMPNGMVQQNPQMAQMQAARQQQQLMLQQQQQNLARQNMPNGGQHYSPEQVAHLQAQQHAQMARQAALQQHHQNQMQQGGQPHPGSQTPQQAFEQNQVAYRAAMQQSVKNQMAQLNQQGMQQQGSPPQPHPTPQQQHAAQMQHQAAMQQQQQQQQHMQNQGQIPNAMTAQQQIQQRQVANHNNLMANNPQYQQQVNNRSQQLFNNYMGQLAQSVGGDHSRIPPPQVANAKKQAMQMAIKQVQEIMLQRSQARQQQMNQGVQGVQVGQTQMMQQMQAQQQHHNMVQYQQQLQQMQQGHGGQGGMMHGVPGAGVMPK